LHGDEATVPPAWEAQFSDRTQHPSILDIDATILDRETGTDAIAATLCELIFEAAFPDEEIPDVEKYLNTVTITIPRNVYGDFNEASKLASRIRIGDVALPDDCTFEDNTENFIGEEPSIEYEAEVHNNYFLFRYYYFEVKVPYREQRI